MLKTSVDDSFASNCIAEKEVDDHMAQTVLDVDDLEIVVDLCKLTYGNPQPCLMRSGKRLQLSLKNVCGMKEQGLDPLEGKDIINLGLIFQHLITTCKRFGPFLFVVNAPESSHNSVFQGEPHVILKDCKGFISIQLSYCTAFLHTTDQFLIKSA